MTGTQRPKFLDMDTLRDRFDRVFSDLMNTGNTADERSKMPVDIHETDETITVKASIPGIKPDQISVEVRNSVLTIRGESQEQRNETDGTWHIVERHVGLVERMITLPAVVDDASGVAKYEDGVLSITFKKTIDKPGKKIEVQTS
ncbi:MAG TPA: Hsp20/alpha crystallin family protein [Nitrolancea sp.]|nr:Hsp20/alpha crystallin family protein [Nitrolancea sp.]